uniref:Uncharacterized protein n=1 Tax=Oryza sativa subsp. japonica TaxID=39947 RepID=Q5Z5H7_ORYSJ|nr:hypothetical protein [Oryza sativa Japonica Group]
MRAASRCTTRVHGLLLHLFASKHPSVSVACLTIAGTMRISDSTCKQIKQQENDLVSKPTCIYIDIRMHACCLLLCPIHTSHARICLLLVPARMAEAPMRIAKPVALGRSRACSTSCAVARGHASSHPSCGCEDLPSRITGGET